LISGANKKPIGFTKRFPDIKIHRKGRKEGPDMTVENKRKSGYAQKTMNGFPIWHMDRIQFISVGA